MKKGSVAIIRLLLEILPAEVVTMGDLHHRLLYRALLRDNLEVIKTLLNYTAPISAAASRNSAMETAASCSFQELIPYLLAKGEDQISIKESYSKKVKEVLRLSYDFHKKEKVKELLQLSRHLYEEKFREGFRGVLEPWHYYEESDDIMRVIRHHVF